MPTCKRNITDGFIVGDCTRRLGNLCHWQCNVGFFRTTTVRLWCSLGMEWNLDVDHICQNTSCELLPTPTNAREDYNCPVRAGLGATCHHSCQPNFLKTAGDTKRECQPGGLWSGHEIQCTAARSVNFGAIVGFTTAAAMVLSSMILLATLCLLSCKARKSKRGDGEVPNTARISGEQNGNTAVLWVEPVPVYDTSTNEVKINGSSSAYENPIYMTCEEARREIAGAEALPVPVKEPMEDNYVEVEDTTFDNPLYNEERVKPQSKEEDPYAAVSAHMVETDESQY